MYIVNEEQQWIAEDAGGDLCIFAQNTIALFPRFIKYSSGILKTKDENLLYSTFSDRAPILGAVFIINGTVLYMNVL